MNIASFTRVASVDPGKTGYTCLMTSWGPPTALEQALAREGVLPPLPDASQGGPDFGFLPTPVSFPDGEDEPGVYDLQAMVQIVSMWRDYKVSLVVIEKQAQRAHGGKKGQALRKEGTKSSWSNGFGFGLWLGILASHGFTEKAGTLVIVEPGVWKRRMAAMVTSHTGEDSDYQRRKAANEATVVAACRVLMRERPEIGSEIDALIYLRATERKSKASSPSPDKCAALLLGVYGMRYVLLQGQKEVPPS